MKVAKYLNEDVLIKKATEVLIREIGPVETIRFMNMPRRKRVESVKRHRQWQKLLDKENFSTKFFSNHSPQSAQRTQRKIRILKMLCF